MRERRIGSSVINNAYQAINRRFSKQLWQVLGEQGVAQPSLLSFTVIAEGQGILVEAGLGEDSTKNENVNWKGYTTNRGNTNLTRLLEFCLRTSTTTRPKAQRNSLFALFHWRWVVLRIASVGSKLLQRRATFCVWIKSSVSTNMHTPTSRWSLPPTKAVLWRAFPTTW